ncbi:amino acid-binding protein [Mycetocola sp. 2940]|uniref:amino acid-binding protein n=1 Tax=Mycetocola sp. 2940 TaxID=3156452 RepID=UPI003399C063
MTQTPSATAAIRCEACGRLPEVPRGRLTIANIATVLPIELAVHAVVLQTALPYLAKVSVLALSATALVIWVAEPSVQRVLRTWLHAGAVTRHRRLHSFDALWRARLVVPDRPGALEQISGSLARLDVNILSVQTEQLRNGVLDEFVLGAPDGVSGQALSLALEDAGASRVVVVPTTPVALTDGPSRALSMATRVVGDSSELPAVLAELLAAEQVENRLSPAELRESLADGTLLKVPSVRYGALLFRRAGDPFTPAESGRANRLAELAEITEYTR